LTQFHDYILGSLDESPLPNFSLQEDSCSKVIDYDLKVESQDGYRTDVLASLVFTRGFPASIEFKVLNNKTLGKTFELIVTVSCKKCED
jgi:hypothetical protein